MKMNNGVCEAFLYPNDRFNPRLIALATDAKSGVREIAISALAMNRTDEGVKTLKSLMDDPDIQIRYTVTHAIDHAYHWRGDSLGRPLKPEDFPSMAGSN